MFQDGTVTNRWKVKKGDTRMDYKYGIDPDEETEFEHQPLSDNEISDIQVCFQNLCSIKNYLAMIYK